MGGHAHVGRLAAIGVEAIVISSGQALLNADLDMTKPTICYSPRCSSPAAYCRNCDLLVGLDGLHVLAVVTTDHHLRVRVESPPGPTECLSYGVVALSYGRRGVVLIEARASGSP